MIRFGLFLGKFEFITNSKSELASESCYINLDKIKKEIELQIEILREIVGLCLWIELSKSLGRLYIEDLEIKRNKESTYKFKETMY